jgi:hypothetical protein
MKAKTKAVITLLVAVALLSGALIILKHSSLPTVTVTLRIAVTPSDQVDFVTARANSAQFKYLVGKQSGIKPALAQKLVSQSVPRSALMEARLGALTQEEGRRYVEAFLPTLQDVCGEQAQLGLSSQSIR